MIVKLVGCGFLGSLFAEELAKRAMALHVHTTIDLFDPDVVSDRNVANQLYNPDEIGMEKGQALGNRLIPYHVMGDFYNTMVTADTQLMGDGADILVCAVDNIKARQLLWSKSVQHSVPLLNLGVAQNGIGSVDWTYLPAGIDTNPFALTQAQTDKQIEDWGKLDAALPPCELVGFRGVGLNMALAASKAFMILFGWDAEQVVHKEKGQMAPWGTFTTWLARNDGHSLVQTMQAKEEE